MANEAPDTGDLGDAGYAGQLVADKIILQRAEGAEILRTRSVFEVILINPAQPSGIGSQSSDDPGREHIANGIEAFQHARASEVGVDLIFKNYREKRETKHRRRPYHFHSREALERNRKSISDLILHFLRRTAWPVSVDDNLIL